MESFVICISGSMNNPPRTDHALTEILPTWGVLVLESHHSDQFTMDWRVHRFLKIIYVLRGKGTFFIDQQEIPFTAGDVILVSPNQKNRIQDDPNAASSLYICCIDEKVWSFDHSIPNQVAQVIHHRNLHFTHRIASAMRRMIHQQPLDSASRPICMVSEALKILELLVQRNQQARFDRPNLESDLEIIERYISYLPSHFFEEQSIDQVCVSLGIARRTFTKHFQKITGSTWLHYIHQLAIEHAKKRLRHSDVPVTSIAFECGFNDLSTFYRQFKRHCGMAPMEYRSQKSD
jgi:AraC-like DNA-binding protein